MKKVLFLSMGLLTTISLKANYCYSSNPNLNCYIPYDLAEKPCCEPLEKGSQKHGNVQHYKKCSIYKMGENNNSDGTCLRKPIPKLTRESNNFLIGCAYNNNIYCIQSAYENDASIGKYVNMKDQNGETPLKAASYNAIPNQVTISIVNLLLKGGFNIPPADANIKDKHGWTALMNATYYPPNKYSVEIVNALLTHDADANIKDKYGWTALMHATYYTPNKHSVKIVNALLTNFADANIKDKHGWTALMNATYYPPNKHSVKIVNALLEKGANPNTKYKNGWTALMYATYHTPNKHSVKIVNALLEKGANPNTKDKNGWTALMFAARVNTLNLHSVKIVNALLEKGANPNIKDKNGWTALESDITPNKYAKEIVTALSQASKKDK